MIHTDAPLLEVDVTNRTSETADIKNQLEEYIGGRGISTKLAHDRIPFDAEWSGPENKLYLAPGPLQYATMSFTGRMNLTGLSPLTGGLLSSNAGGYLSRNFTETGYSVVEIAGMSDELVAVHVTDKGVSFEEVPDLAEATVPEVTQYMNKAHDLGADNLVTVGPAGENGVRFASAMTYDNRAFGRGGLGAALGAKNIKCISFEGSSKSEVNLPNQDLHLEVHREASTVDDPMKRQGTTHMIEFANDNFSLPTRYFSEKSFENVAQISGDRVEEKKHEKASCSACAFACKLPTKDEETGLETEGPEFETIFAFGSNAGVDDIVSVMKSNELCDTLGMDTIECGNVVSAYLASEEEFGNEKLIKQITRKIAYREDVGDLLAEGVARASGELGVEKWATKGLSFAAHDGRVLHGQGLSYAVANRGADHMYSTTLVDEYTGEMPPEGLEGKPEVVAERENRNAIRDSAIVCQFSRSYLNDEQYEKLLGASIDEILRTGAKIVELERHFNNKRGMDRDDDTLPYDIPEFEKALDEYYEIRGWTQDGIVPDERLSERGTAAD